MFLKPLIVPCVVVLSVAQVENVFAGGTGAVLVNGVLLCMAAWLFTRELHQQRRDFQLELDRQRAEAMVYSERQTKDSQRWRHAMLNVVNADGLLKRVDEEAKRMEKAGE